MTTPGVISGEQRCLRMASGTTRNVGKTSERWSELQGESADRRTGGPPEPPGICWRMGPWEKGDERGWKAWLRAHLEDLVPPSCRLGFHDEARNPSLGGEKIIEVCNQHRNESRQQECIARNSGKLGRSELSVECIDTCRCSRVSAANAFPTGSAAVSGTLPWVIWGSQPRGGGSRECSSSFPVRLVTVLPVCRRAGGARQVRTCGLLAFPEAAGSLKA